MTKHSKIKIQAINFLLISALIHTVCLGGAYFYYKINQEILEIVRSTKASSVLVDESKTPILIDLGTTIITPRKNVSDSK